MQPLLRQSLRTRTPIRRESIRSKISMLEAERRAIGYLNEIVSDYSSSAVRFADMTLTRLWTQLYDGVEVHNFSTVRELAKEYEIIYTQCHRSHIDIFFRHPCRDTEMIAIIGAQPFIKHTEILHDRHTPQIEDLFYKGLRTVSGGVS